MKLVNSDVDDLKGHLASLDLGHVQNIVQQAQQIVAGVPDDREVFALRVFQSRRSEQLSRSQYTVHGSPQLMRNHAEKV